MNVLMFHSVGNDSSNWYRKWLSVSLHHFEMFCIFLAKNKYNSGFLEDWYTIQNHPSKDSKKQIILTFDDGYLDNWVFVFPILKKYNLRGTIFINPEFVEPSIRIRSNLEDVWGRKISSNELSTLGFLNWPEIQAMDSSGLIDIQSHSMSHNFYFYSDKIIDIYTGQPNYDWLTWLHKPEQKPFYINEDQSNCIPQGHPVFEFDRALALRRYFPDIRLIKYAEEVYKHSNKVKNNKSVIATITKKLSEFPGYYETDFDMGTRYRYELFESKKLLEEKLNKKVDFLCWPGGGYNNLSIKLSKEVGYKASTLSSRDSQSVVDNTKEYKRIERIGIGSFIQVNSELYLVRNRYYLIQMFKALHGNVILRIILKLQKELIIMFFKLKKHTFNHSYNLILNNRIL